MESSRTTTALATATKCTLLAMAGIVAKRVYAQKATQVAMATIRRARHCGRGRHQTAQRCYKPCERDPAACHIDKRERWMALPPMH
eukprot:356027-Chlamydomonas_euryale.AAC.3